MGGRREKHAPYVHGVEDETLLLAEVREVQRLVAALPDRDVRAAEEILGYDAFGLPD